jgi:hypothetical protein
MKNTGRIFSKFANDKIKVLLNTLSKKNSPDEYRDSMAAIGSELGKAIMSQNPKCKYFYIVCTVEDADFLARGMIESLSAKNIKFNLACFWNSHETTGKIGSISPVIRKYIEPYSPPKNGSSGLVILKSIISGSCVVKTNLKEIIEKIRPKEIIVTAPVIHEDSIKKLEAEFDKEIVKKFKFVYFATDSKKTKDGMVKPGVGGDVYKLLGFKTQNVKNKYTPKVVKERREAYL